MNSKEQAKEELIKLVKDFKNNPDYYKKLSEADVEDKLVNELFVNILGWDKKDYEKRAKVRRGDKGGSADYAFKINDRIVFFLEVKKVTIPLDKEADEQVISYALSKKVPFAVSTNFEQLKIFCVEESEEKKVIFRAFSTPDDYLNKFDDLLLLSKDSFEQGLLFKEAIKQERLKRRVSIDKVLLEDFWRVRTLIANDIEKNKSGKYNINEKDEIVQRILDRLIFIRRCEDIGINPENLTLEEIKHVAESRAYSQLKALFTKYDSVYNSGLFTPNKDNDCDIITIDGSIIQKLISYLYESHDKKYKYNFEWIDADVLGQVYEQYLGKILAQTKSGKAKLKEGQAHRKEQGIYYTPTYIVDYIVKNTLGELLKDKKVDARKIKILDPACGSGSFLIKAFDYMEQHLSQNEEAKQHKLDFQGSYSVKTSILKDNIYGVDLDNKAVEITKLNLLLKAAEKFRKLPSELDNHIGWGNSLIDDDTFEHPFKWVGDFQEGTFDVVIGNPPYVSGWNMDLSFRDWVINKSKYQSAKKHWDLYILFIERGISLLKQKGYLSFILPYSFLNQAYAEKIREIILEKCRIVTLVDLSSLDIFADATVRNCIIVLQKNKIRDNSITIIKYLNIDNNKRWLISQNIFEEMPEKMFRVDLFNTDLKIIKKVKLKSISLGEIVYSTTGVVPHSEKENKPKEAYIHNKKINSLCVPYIEGKNIGRYLINYGGRFLEYNPKVVYRPSLPELLVQKKILIKNVIGRTGIAATLDNNGYFTNETINCVTTKNNLIGIKRADIHFTLEEVETSKKYDLKFILGVINSKLSNFVYKKIDSGDLHFYPKNVRSLYIYKIERAESSVKNIIIAVDKMLSLNKQLQEIGDKKTAQTAKLEEEIKKTDEEIDELVYKLYSITEAEKKIIEESLK